MSPLLKSSGISLLAGGLYALCYPSPLMGGWFPLLFLALPLFLWRLTEAKSFKESILIILAYNLGLNLVGYYWIPHTLREFGQLPYVVSVLLGMSFTLILQPHWLLYALWRSFRPQWKWESETGILVTALIMTIMERYFPQQFPSYAGSPWLHLAPYLNMAPYFGVTIFSFVSYWMALEAVEQLKMKKFRPQVWMAAFVFVLMNAVFPLPRKESPKQLNVRVVQANVGNFLKVASERGDHNSFESINDKYERLSSLQNGFKPDLIVWPETAYSNAFPGKAERVPPIFKSIMEKTGSEMLIGGYVQDMSKPLHEIIESVYNASILMDENRIKESYHKNILIPFGETLPFGPLNRQIVSVVPAISLFAAGEGTPLMETKAGYRFVTPICYEILESNYMRDLLNQHKGNHFIVNHTNDSWYGDTAEPWQHLFLSKWRALEFQMPIVRSTNTGVTSVIFPDGSESKQLDVGEEDVLDVAVPMGNGNSTVYQLYGVLPFLALVSLLLGLTWWREKN